MRKHTINRRKRRAVYLSMATVALLFAFVGIFTVDVPRGSASFLNVNERGLWSAVSVLAESADATRSETWKSHATEPRATVSPDPPSPFVSLVAVIYKSVKKAFRFSLRNESVTTTRIVLAIVNLPLLALFFAATIGCIDRVGCTKWSRFASASATCFATMLLPLSASLNYQLPAAAATAATLWMYVYAGDRLAQSFELSSRFWVAAGFTAALAASFQFSAALMLLPWIVLFRRLDHTETPRVLAGAALGVAFFVGSWVVYYTLVDHGQNGLVVESASISLKAPANLLHSTVGHHGLFSLTPLWLLLPLALVTGIRLEPTDFRELAIAVAVASLICLVVAVVAATLGYEGQLSQVYPSQLNWMTPLWILMLTPLIEQFEASRRRRHAVIALIAISAFSALTAFPSVSSAPWLYHLWSL